MSSEQALETYSSAALKGAIDSLQASGLWPRRLLQLKRELARRKAKAR